MANWNNAGERLPKSGQRVLLSDGVWVGEGYGVNDGRRMKWYRHYGMEAGYVGEIKYWAEMPEGPEVKNEH